MNIKNIIENLKNTSKTRLIITIILCLFASYFVWTKVNLVNLENFKHVKKNDKVSLAVSNLKGDMYAKVIRKGFITKKEKEFFVYYSKKDNKYKKMSKEDLIDSKAWAGNVLPIYRTVK